MLWFAAWAVNEFQTDQCGHRERLDLGIAAEVPADNPRSKEGGPISAHASQ